MEFDQMLDRQFQGCKVMVALIDSEWVTAVDRKGRRRLDVETDFVRLEVAAALARGIRTVPVLVDGAEMPDSAELPDILKPLTKRQALPLEFSRFDEAAARPTVAIRYGISSTRTVAQSIKSRVSRISAFTNRPRVANCQPLAASERIVRRTPNHFVHGFVRKDGAYVHSYHAENPDNTRNKNDSTRGNVNP